MIEALVTNIRLFLLVFFRIVAMVEVAPLLSSTTIPQVAKVGLSLFAAVTVFPGVLAAGYAIPPNTVDYVLLVLGEAAIGLLIGFLVLLVFSAFQVAGQFFSLHMGFSASEVFDPLSQVEIPLMGEFLNLVAMMVFISVSGLGKFLLAGVQGSFAALRAIDLVTGKEAIVQVLVRGLSGLFTSALTISFPILGTLLLVSIAMGLLAKASPQMDVLTMSFPVSIGVSFILLFAALPILMTAFGRLVDAGYDTVNGLLAGLARGGAR
jgi:flagellar biosynthetic protein FliR